MKRILPIMSMVLCLVFIISGCSKVDIQKLPAVKTLKNKGAISVAVSSSLQGLCQLSKDQKPEGMEPEIARYIALQVYGSNKQVDFYDMDAKFTGPKLETGAVDMIIAGFESTETRKTKYELSKPYYTDHLAMLVKVGSPLTLFGQMEGKKIGFIAGSGADTLIKAEAAKYNMNILVIPCASYSEARDKLTNGEIDVLCARWTALRALANKKTVMLGERIGKLEYCIACKLGDKEMLNLLNAVIDDMQKKGMLQSLVQQWGLEDTAAIKK